MGRTTFELGRIFDAVVGVDLSTRFVEAANTLRKAGAIDYFRRDEGELGERVTVSLEELNLTRAASRVSFATGDACNLGPEHTGYDLIFAGNLIDRLQDPGAFLADIHRRLADNGTLVISSPYTLMAEFTPRANWIGGFEHNGQPRTVLDGMKDILSGHFEPVQAPMDIPFVIRETRRKFQHTIAELDGLAPYPLESGKADEQGGLGRWPQLRVVLPDAAEFHPVAVATGNAPGPVAEFGAVPLELVVFLAEFTGSQAEQRVVLPVGCGHQQQPRAVFAEHRHFHFRQLAGIHMLDGFHHGGGVETRQRRVALGVGAPDQADAIRRLAPPAVPE